MDILADASVFLAVVLDETDRQGIIEKTTGCTVISPEVLPYGIANALIAMKIKGRLTDREVVKAFDIFQRIAVRLVPVRISEAIKIALNFKIYTYDAFYIQCCIEARLPLISLDKRMCDVAEDLGIKVVM